jgi:hypothetical protein
MKYFGEYLVEKQIVSAESLVQAVLQQCQSQPLVARIAFEKNFFTADEMIRIFSYQQEHQLDFLAAGHAAGLMSAEKRQTLDTELQSHHLPLAGILLKNGSIGVKELVHALDEFLSTAKTAVSPLVASAKVNPPPSSTNLPTFNFKPIDATFSNELQVALAANKIAEIVNVLQLVKQNASFKDLVQEFLQDVLRSIHIIRGLAKAAKAPVIDQICTDLDVAIVKELRSNQPNSIYIIEKLVPAIEQGFRFCEKLRDSIIKHQSEQAYWDTPSNQTLYQDFVKSLEN